MISRGTIKKMSRKTNQLLQKAILVDKIMRKVKPIETTTNLSLQVIWDAQAISERTIVYYHDLPKFMPFNSEMNLSGFYISTSSSSMILAEELTKKDYFHQFR